MTIMYGLRVLLYGFLSAIIGYSTVIIIPIFTPLGGIVETGIIFFTALLIHELVAYRGQKEKFQNHQLNFSLQTKKLNKALYTLQQSLIETVKKLKLPLPKLPFIEEIENIEKLLQKKDIDPKNFIQLLELQIQVLQPLVQTVASFSPEPSLINTGPSLSSSPSLSPTIDRAFSASVREPNFPKFSLSPFLKAEKTVKTEKAPSLISASLMNKEPSLSLQSKISPSGFLSPEESPNIIPFLQKSTPTAIPYSEDSLFHRRPADSSVFTKKYVLEQVNHALHHNHFDMIVDQIFDLSSKQVLLKRCFPCITLANKQQILYHQFIDWAVEENIHFYIDHVTLGNVLQMAKDSHQHHPVLQYLCGVHMNSLNNDDFVHTYIEFVQNYPELCARVIFEINHLHFNRLSFIERLQQLSIKGFNFALFSAHLELPKELISSVPFYYYLLDAHQILRHLHGVSSLPLIQSVKHFLQNHNTEMIMLNVDNEEKIISTFLKAGISYGQGGFFSSPSFTQSYR